MNELFRDREHLVRLVILLAAALVIAIVVRTVMVPKGFGLYGHYRAGALDDARSRPVAFAGHAACESCHTDVVDARKGSKHAALHCETCHGALAKHAENPTEVKPVLPDHRRLCLNCHAANVARPAWFKTIEVAEHAGDAECTTCHVPHHPEPEATK